MHSDLLLLVYAVVGSLIAGTLAAACFTWFGRSEGTKKLATNLRQRMWSWWLLTGLFVGSLATGGVATVVIFGITSFLALREFVTLVPTKRGDHRSLFWAFFVVLPVQYVFVGYENYGMYTIFIPVYAFLLIPARSALAGETEDYLSRTSRIQWGLMTCVYFVSHVPALLSLELRGDASPAALLMFLVVVCQLNDVFQYIVGKCFGKRKVAPSVSPNKTVEGLVGGLIASAILGASLSWATPFEWWAGGAIGVGIAVMGFLGDLSMSAVKRDLGVKDFSDMLPGHGGVLDRLDSLSFAAPVFLHVVRFFYGVG